MESYFGREQDHAFMKKALKQAYVAYHKQEVPIGALIVDEQGAIVARSHNKTELVCSQAGHAEMDVMMKSGKKNSDWRLEGCWLYVTLEPCAMCMHMIALSRLAGVVYGAASPRFGYQLDKVNQFEVYKKDTLKIVHGVGALESSTLLRIFFKEIRRGKKWLKQRKEQENELI